MNNQEELTQSNVDGFIPEEDYKKIVTRVALPCVDVVVVSDGKFLLGKRRIDPMGGEWWVPGGRVLMGEKLLEAVGRKLKDDFGLESGYDEPKFLFVGETIFENPEGGFIRHTVNAVYRVDFQGGPDFDFEKSGISDFSEVGWFSEVDKSWHQYVKFCLEKAGFK